MSLGLTITLAVAGCILTGLVIGAIVTFIVVKILRNRDRISDARQTQINAVENAFYAAGCRGWFVKYLGACAVGDQLEMARLSQEMIETEDSVKFFMDNVGRSCKAAVEYYDAEQKRKQNTTS